MSSTPEVPTHDILVISPDHKERDKYRQQCYDVRIDVFVREQRFSLEEEIDELDKTATHFLLRLTPDGMPIGTIRGSKSADGTYYKLSRLAILKDYRKYRFGRELVLMLHDWIVKDATEAGKQGHAKVVCHSQLYVKGFYAKLGYEPEGEEFDEDGAPHQRMVLQLSINEQR